MHQTTNIDIDDYSFQQKHNNFVRSKHDINKHIQRRTGIHRQTKSDRVKRRQTKKPEL